MLSRINRLTRISRINTISTISTISRKTPFSATIVCLLFASGCASSPWTRAAPPLYTVPGIVLYREHQERDGQRVPLGYRHPIELPIEKTAILLSQLAYRKDRLFKSQNTYVFTQDEVASAAEPLSRALREITPDERLRFLILRSSWKEVLLGSYGTSGVIFSTGEGVVNLAFDNIDEQASVPEGGEPMKIRFPVEPTELTDASPIVPSGGMKLHVGPDGTKFPRWVEVRIAAVKPLAPAAPPQPAPQPQPPPAIAVPERPPLEGAPRPSAAAAPQRAAPVPPPASDHPRSAEEEARYESIRMRLETLGRLKKDGAITEAQYQEEYRKVMAELR